MYPTTEHDTQPFLFPPDPAAGSEPPERRPRRTGLVAGLAATALAAGVVGGVVGAQFGGDSGPTASSLTSAGGSIAAPASAPRSYAAIAARVLPAVVNIDVAGQGQSDTGTGVVIRSDGYILTNNHVVSAAQGGGSISVTFNDGTHAGATIRGTDPTYDLAVIKVSRSGLTAATFGQSASVRVGDPVLALGSPLGLSGTVTSGIVSAINRAVQTSDAQQSNPFGTTASTTTVINAIQTDAAINPGNSGGPLVDAAGQVIGINSAIASLGSSLGGQSGNIGVGFAIPIDQARYVAQQLISTGHATHPILGVGLPVDDSTSSTQDGVVVESVESGKPAAQAGIRVGDVILAVDGTPVNSSDALIATIRSYRPGEQVSLTFRHGSTRHTVTVTLADSTTDG